MWPYQADRPRHARDIRGRVGLALDCRSGPGPRTARCRARSSSDQGRQDSCLDRRIPDKQTLSDEIAAWEHDRNARHTKADWHFTTSNARIKLKHLYPSI